MAEPTERPIRPEEVDPLTINTKLQKKLQNTECLHL
jgi:hypothetical protein